jgi:hypothetical protein
MIEEKYKNIIDQCEKRIDELNDWEKGFILGEEDNPKKPPLNTRTYLSTAQKNILDRIVVQRFEGGKWDKNNIQMEYGDVGADRTNEGWVVHIAGYPIGLGMVRKEVPIITAWLHSALPALLQIPHEALKNYLNGQKSLDDIQIEKKQEVTEEDPF